MVAANGLQQQYRKHVSFKESAGTGLVGFVGATSPAVEFFEKQAPSGTRRGIHDIAPGRLVYFLEMRVADEGAQGPYIDVLS